MKIKALFKTSYKLKLLEMLWWKFKHNLKLNKAGHKLLYSLDVWETC